LFVLHPLDHAFEIEIESELGQGADDDPFSGDLSRVTTKDLSIFNSENGSCCNRTSEE
jgi:hypothetical protein